MFDASHFFVCMSFCVLKKVQKFDKKHQKTKKTLKQMYNFVKKCNILQK